MKNKNVFIANTIPNYILRLRLGISEFYNLVNNNSKKLMEVESMEAEFIRQRFGEKAMNDAIYGSRVEKLMNKSKNTDKMGKQTIYTVPDGVEVEKFEFDGLNAVITFKDKDVFVPKDGDVCVGINHLGNTWIYIFESEDDVCHVILYESELKFNDWCSTHIDDKLVRRRATPTESAKLFAAMEKAGYKWNAEEKKVEKIRWRAKLGESYWCLDCNSTDIDVVFAPQQIIELGNSFDNANYLQGDYHRTEADCQKLCDQLNATVKNFVA